MFIYDVSGYKIGELYEVDEFSSMSPIKVDMKISQTGLDLIKMFEGFRSEPYLCPSDIPTIGYGTTRYNDGTKVTLQDKAISKDFATAMLRFQCDSIYGDAVNDYTLIMDNQNRFDALTSFTYNVGREGLRTSTLLKKHNSGDVIGASKEFKKWKYSNGEVSSGLVKRRKLEKKLYLL